MDWLLRAAVMWLCRKSKAYHFWAQHHTYETPAHSHVWQLKRAAVMRVFFSALLRSLQQVVHMHESCFSCHTCERAGLSYVWCCAQKWYAFDFLLCCLIYINSKSLDWNAWRLIIFLDFFDDEHDWNLRKTVSLWTYDCNLVFAHSSNMPFPFCSAQHTHTHTHTHTSTIHTPTNPAELHRGESCHTCEWVVSEPWVGHVKRARQYRSHVSHVNMSQTQNIYMSRTPWTSRRRDKNMLQDGWGHVNMDERLSRVQMSNVTRTNEPWHTCECTVPRTWMRHGTRMSEWCHTNVYEPRFSCEWQSCHAWHLCSSHAIHMHEPCHVYIHTDHVAQMNTQVKNITRHSTNIVCTHSLLRTHPPTCTTLALASTVATSLFSLSASSSETTHISSPEKTADNIYQEKRENKRSIIWKLCSFWVTETHLCGTWCAQKWLDLSDVCEVINLC